MGKNYSGPLGLTSGTGISNRVYEASCSASSSQDAITDSNFGNSVGSGGARGIEQGGSSPGKTTSCDRGLHKFAVCSAQKGRRESPCSESKAIKSIHNIRTFQNGRYSYVKRPSKTGGLVGKNRPQGCLFNSTHLDKSSEILSFSVERQHARVCLSPLRFSFCPDSIHEADETSCSSIETAGHSANNLFRRHVNYGRILRPSASSGSFSIESPREFRFHSKLREMPFGANSRDRISGLVSKFKKPYAYFTGRKTKKNSETLQTIARNLGPVDTRVVKVPRAFDLLYSSHIPSPPPLQEPTAVKKSGHDCTSIIQGDDFFRPGGQRGVYLVEGSPSGMEWQSTFPKTCRSPHRDRRLSKRLGGILPRYKHRGAMVLRRKASTHQLYMFGAAGLVIRDPDIYKRQSLRSCQTADGQHSSSSLYKQDGRNPLAGSFKSSCTTMGVVPPKQLGDICSTSTRTFKCQSRPGIQNVTGFQRLETKPLDVSITSEEMGALGDRSLCIPADTPAPKVCQLETRSLSSAFRCIFNELERHSGVCISPLCSVGRCLQQVRTQNVELLVLVAPVWPAQTWYPLLLHLCTDLPLLFPTQTGDERQSVSPSGQPTTGWMETIRQRYDTADISEATRNLLLAAWRKNTTSTYASAWSKWVGWCDRRQVNPLSAPLSLILESLKDQFEEGKAYRSLNVYRSALSALLLEIDSFKVGSHPLVSQLLKGAFNLKPPKPRYSHTWSVGKVLDFIKSLGPNKDLDIKVLSYKLVALLGLTAPDRSSDLAKRDLKFRSFHPEGVSFCLPGLTKTSKPGDSPKISFHAAFPLDKNLCPVECLRSYEERTIDFRPKNDSLPNPLFLSFIRPHNPVCSSSLARWIKSFLSLSGIDTTIFSAHSLREAATSTALIQGVSVSEILSMADWSQESTFRKFYYKPRFNSAPGNAVLSGSSI